MKVEDFSKEAEGVLGDRLIAIYQYGSNFARGPKAKDAHLLMVVSDLGAGLLSDVRPLAKKARDANFRLRFDTENDILCCADVFPVFVLELLDTKSLLHGEDVLTKLEVHPEHLRHRVEQGLRALHRDLLRAYVADEDDTSLARDLRQAVRKSVYLLRALGLANQVELPETPSVEVLIDKVVASILPEADHSVWHRMRRMANFEETVPADELTALYGAALQAFSELVDAVDNL